MPKKKYPLAKDLLQLCESNPNAVIACSDYFGYEHALYHPTTTFYRKDEPYPEDFPSAAGFLNNKKKFKQDTIYIGHQTGLQCEEQPLFASDLMSLLEKYPKALIAASDYFGSEHSMYHPEFFLRSEGEYYDLSPDNGNVFLTGNSLFAQNTLYIGR